MTEYVPVRQVRRLATRAKSDGDIMPDDTPAKRLGHKLADDIEECVEEHAVTEAEVCDRE
jgi:hypothetical protein